MFKIKNKIKNKKASRWFIGSIMAVWLFLAAILADLTEDVVNMEPVVTYDNHLMVVFTTLRTALGTEIFSYITLLGNWRLIFLASMIIIIGLYLWRQRSFILPFIFTVLSAEIITYVGKILIHRYRPENGVMVLSDFSFPSGHSTVAVTFYGFLAYIVICQLKSRWSRSLAASLALLVVILIGYSRLYLGVHFFSDVLAGYLIGFLALIAGISLREWLIVENPSHAGSN